MTPPKSFNNFRVKLSPVNRELYKLFKLYFEININAYLMKHNTNCKDII